MKRFTAFLIALALLFAAAVGVIAGKVNALSDKVTVTERTLYGDKAAADGLTLTMGTTYLGRLYWDTDYTVGAGTKPETVYSYYAEEQREPGRRIYGFFMMDGIDLYPTHTLAEGEEPTGIDAAISALWEATPNGQKATETVYLKDYYDYYPMIVSIETGANTALKDGPTHQAFSEYFRIPVEDRDTVTIKANKVQDSASFNNMDSYMYGDYFTFVTNDAVAESRNICFFEFNNCYYDTDGVKNYVDTSLIPGGWGIYAFTFDPDVLFDSVNKGEGFLTGDIQTVLPLEKETEVYALLLNGDESRLLIFTEETDGAYLTVLDTDTLLETQRIRVGDTGFYQIDTEEDFTVAATQDSFTVLTEENGVFTLQYTVNTPILPEIVSNKCWSIYDMDYKNGRLAWAGAVSDYRSEHNCDYCMAVFDKTGLLYLGEFTNGTGAPKSDFWNYNCDRAANDMLDVKWK